MSSTEDRIAAGAAARVALDRGNPEPAPESDEREAATLADAVTDLLLDRLGSRAIEVDVLDQVHEAITQRVDALLARRTRPAPRTVSAAEAWDEGFERAHAQHYAEDLRLGRRTPAINADNPYETGEGA